MQRALAHRQQIYESTFYAAKYSSLMQITAMGDLEHFPLGCGYSVGMENQKKCGWV